MMKFDLLGPRCESLHKRSQLPNLGIRAFVLIFAVSIAFILVGEFGNGLIPIISAAEPGVSRPELRSNSANSPSIGGIPRTAPANYGQLPMSFEPNAGQTDARVQFLSRGAGYTLFLTDHEAVLSLQDLVGEPKAAENLRLSPKHDPRNAAVLRMKLMGANTLAAISGVDELPGKTNYFRGSDRKLWQTNVATYGKVRYQDVYPGVDLVYYGQQGQLEYDFMVAPGADPQAIALSFAGTRSVAIDHQTGDLVLQAGRHEVRFHQPVVYQAGAGSDEKHLIDAHYALTAKNQITFQIAPYDHSKALVIDPTLSYSTYLGSTSNDYGNAIAVDAAGNAYVVGYTSSLTFPVTSGALQTSCGGGCPTGTFDAFVSKLNPTGAALVYSTYLGGSGKDYGNGIAVDATGDVYIVGQTFSSDFPVTAGAFKTSCGTVCAVGQAFVTELDPTGSTLLYSTYLGGSTQTQGNAIVLDGSGNAYVTGFTRALDFPITPGVVQSVCGSCSKSFVDVFVTKFNSTGTALIYSTYLGGKNADVGYAIALDSSGNVYVTGYTFSTNFPTTAGAFQTTLGAQTSAFASKLNSTATALIYSTYLGGNATGTNACAACGSGIAVDSAGNAYVAGLTWETNFPTTAGAYQPGYAGGFHDAFITKLNPSGTGLVYSTYVGGTNDDGATAIALDSSGDAYVRGNTFSTNFPTSAGAFQTAIGGGSSTNSDGFVLILNPQGSSLLYSTYLGGSSSEYGNATQMIALDSAVPPSIYVTGWSNSTKYPTTTGALQTTLGGKYDAFVSQLAPSPNLGLSAPLNFGNQSVGTTSSPQTVTVTNTGNSNLNVTAVNLTGANKTEYSQTNTCVGSSVAPQNDCTVSVKFTPSTTGTRTANVSITHDAPKSPQTLALTGVGVGTGPAVTLSPTSLAFGTQLVKSTSAPQTVTLTNTGFQTLNITSITSSSGDFAQTNNCGSTVAAGANCTITVTFTPTTPNARTGTITITDDAPASPHTVSLTGTGTYVSISPLSLDFGSVQVGTSGTPQNVTLTNTATTSLGIKSISTGGGNSADFSQTNTCGTSVGPNASCTITVTFKPLATGSRTSSLIITDFQAGTATQTVPLSGTGTN